MSAEVAMKMQDLAEMLDATAQSLVDTAVLERALGWVTQTLEAANADNARMGNEQVLALLGLAKTVDAVKAELVASTRSVAHGSGLDVDALYARGQALSFQHDTLEARRATVPLQASLLRLERDHSESEAVLRRLNDDEATLERLNAEIDLTRSTIAAWRGRLEAGVLAVQAEKVALEERRDYWRVTEARLQSEVDQARELDLSDYVKSLTAELASRTHMPPATSTSLTG